MEEHRASGVDFFKRVVYEMGEGNCILFWNDPWSGHLPLKDLYPALFVFI